MVEVQDYIQDTERLSDVFRSEYNSEDNFIQLVERIPSVMFQYENMNQGEENEAASNRILIVDDEPFNLFGLETVLNLAEEIIKLPPGFITKILDKASNGEEAVEAYKKLYYTTGHVYALIITDLSMPVMDGF